MELATNAEASLHAFAADSQLFTAVDAPKQAHLLAPSHHSSAQAAFMGMASSVEDKKRDLPMYRDGSPVCSLSSVAGATIALRNNTPFTVALFW